MRHRPGRAANLVNVSSLFYPVPGGAVLLDWWLLDNRMAAVSLAGLGAIVLRLVRVFRVRPR